MSVRTARPLLIALGAAAIAAFGAAPASAGVLVASAPDCSSPDSSQVFLPWADPASYFLAPDGALEDGGAGWALDGASVVAANESFAVSGAGTSALAIPNGATATSPTICIGLEHPTVRFFARKTSGNGPSPATNSLRVDVLVEDNAGVVSSLPVGSVGGTSSWQPSAPLLVTASLLPLLPGDHTPVAFRFTPQGGDWQVDDLYVDPYGSR